RSLQPEILLLDSQTFFHQIQSALPKVRTQMVGMERKEETFLHAVRGESPDTSCETHRPRRLFAPFVLSPPENRFVRRAFRRRYSVVLPSSWLTTKSCKGGMVLISAGANSN